MPQKQKLTVEEKVKIVRDCLKNRISITLIQATPIRYLFSSYLSHIIVEPTNGANNPPRRQKSSVSAEKDLPADSPCCRLKAGGRRGILIIVIQPAQPDRGAAAEDTMCSDAVLILGGTFAVVYTEAGKGGRDKYLLCGRRPDPGKRESAD